MVDQAPLFVPAALIRSKTRPPGPSDGQNALDQLVALMPVRGPGERRCHIVVHSLLMGVPGKGE
jgi:hypothetical protein